ncbi:hypothetical protein chiPu_0023403 [Chiloscyllium punctatum]|uniref:Uncharacterized protein n=1 Tax=Chiloscyllium punctatum TaxID=137246 RepID=A0A401TAT9_CHIPU|nr:hypothetical protein [Chiloscyllium punctatum]
MVLEQLRKHVGKYGWTSYLEPRLVTSDGKLWKPDIIFKKDNSSKVAVVDVTVRFENNDQSLEQAWTEKTQKYKHLSEEVERLPGGTEPQFFGFVSELEENGLERMTP